MRLLRLLPVLPLLGGMSTAGAIAAVGPSAVGCASAASAHHAALVIEHGDGSTLEYCIGFDTAQVTGQYLLDASGVEKAEQAYGSTGQAVCQLDNEPQQYPPGCWTASSPYWALYLSRGGGSWMSSSLGVSSQTFSDGDAEGFRYEGQSAYLTPVSPAGICPVATAPPGPTAAAHSSPRSTAPVHPSAAVAAGAAPSAPTAPTASRSAGAAFAASPSSSGRAPGVVVVEGSSTGSPASSFTPGAGLIAAAALAAAMLVLLILQAVRASARRRSASS